MKPASIINRGEDFVTLRATTDRPAEIREALSAREVFHILKGDQNQAWDAVLANHCLSRAVGDSGAEITFFVQDERLGTPDARLARHWRRHGRRYVLTEDYYRGRSGAVWEHQDVSYGLFYTEAVSPEQYARAGVHLHRAVALWERHQRELLADGRWVRALAALGVAAPGSEARPSVSGLGPSADPEALEHLAFEHPTAALYYAFTKSDGLYGLVPVENDNAVLSSIPAGDPEIRAGAGRLLLLACRGAMRQAGTALARRGVKLRARRLADWAESFLRQNPAASIADFQAALGLHLTREVFPLDRIDLDRTSHFTHVSRHDYFRLREPRETLHFYLDLALRHPREFAEAYNEALNRVGLGLQRIKYDRETGRYTPPFFVEFAPDGPGTPVFRYGLELIGRGPVAVTLTHARGDVVFESPHPIRSAYDLADLLFRQGDFPDGFSLVGKAAPFAAELQRQPRGLGLPRQGSRYAPLVDHLVAGLRRRGVLQQPNGLLIRIGLNALDRLAAMGELPLRVPPFLQSAFGAVCSCSEAARRWRAVAGEAAAALRRLGSEPFGRYLHLWRRLLDETPPELEYVRSMIPEPVQEEVRGLLEHRSALLAERRQLAAEACAATPRGRVRPDPERMAALERERETVELKLLLLFAAVVRRLWQRAESLAYLNDRPYTLGLYLLFGAEVFPPICREVEFDLEYVSPCPLAAAEVPCPTASPAR